MADPELTIQEIVKRRQRAAFVGRESQLAWFGENLALPVDSDLRRFIVNIHGDAGVGKTFLTEQFRRIAAEHGAVCAVVNEDTFDVPSVMAQVARDLGRDGVHLSAFDEEFSLYERRRRELISDPQAPDGVMRLLTSTAVRLGLGTMKSLPIVGAVADAVDAESAVEQAERFRTYLAGKFPDQDVRLLLSPTEMLTPSFLAGLRRVAAKRPVALFFDTFERTALWCETWLLDLFGGRYGALPANLVVGVAGQHPLDPNRWSGYAGILAKVELAPFTEDEARGLCLRKGVRDERVIRLILGLSGRLPLLVAMLAQNQPGDPAEVGDPSDDAVERFLKWETDEERRAVALLAAFPRTLNEDVLGVLVSPETAGAAFSWLRGQPFVSGRAGGYAYHAAVRTPMLRTQRSRSPLDWRRRHRSLRERHQQWRDELRLPESQRWNDPSWQHHLLEELYHGLCADPNAHLNTALEQVVHAHRADIALTRRVLDAIRQAGEEVESELLLAWADRLAAHAGGSSESSVELMTILLETAPLSARAQTDALYARAWACLSLKRFENALVDLDRAVELDPGHAWGIALRGGIRHLTGRNDQALADLDRAVELDPRFAGAVAVRGTVHRVMGNHEQALADLDRSIELGGNASMIANRGMTYQALRRYDEALADLDRALELDPDQVVHLAARGETHRLRNDHVKALADLDRALELDPGYAWALAARGETHRVLNDYDRALADLDRALVFDPDYAWALASRGQTYHALRRYDEALADLDRALGFDPGYAWALAARGETHRVLGDHGQALADLDRAIELSPGYAWALASRGTSRYQLGRYDDALADLDQAVELDPGYAWALALRGETHRVLGDHGQALADLDRAMELDPAASWHVYASGLTRLSLGDRAAADEAFRRALDLGAREVAAGDTYGNARLNLGVYLAALGDHTEASKIFESETRIRPGNVSEGIVHALRILRDLLPGQAEEIDALIGTLREVT